MKKTGAQIIIDALRMHSIDTVTGIPGGSSLPLYDELTRSGIRHILARHEQGAGFIAQGMARVSGRAAVCLATSGPGATNLVTAVADAKKDSIPMVAITGQVPTSLIGTDAFQEIDTVAMMRPLAKAVFAVTEGSELIDILPRAFTLAESGRQGPVVIDVPRDVQVEEVEISRAPAPLQAACPGIPDREALHEMQQLIECSERPVIFAGGGIISSGASGELVELAHLQDIPVSLSLMGLGAFPADDDLYLGMLGMHGARYTNMIMEEVDLIIALGTRFDDRATGRVRDFCPDAKVIHVDIDPVEIDKIRKSHLHFQADVRTTLRHLLQIIERKERPRWRKTIKGLRASHPLPNGPVENPFDPRTLIKSIASFADRDAIITTDVGQHQMWTAQEYPFTIPRTFLTSGGLGTMGFGLPTAIGAALAAPDRQVICISGDGSIQMNIQEMALLAELNLNVKVIIMNNASLGLVRQQQKLFFDGNYSASSFNMPLDFAALGRNFGLRSISLHGSEEPMRDLANMIKTPGPCIIDIPVCPDEMVFPMVPPGGANKEMIDAMEVKKP